MDVFGKSFHSSDRVASSIEASLGPKCDHMTQGTALSHREALLYRFGIT